MSDCMRPAVIFKILPVSVERTAERNNAWPFWPLLLLYKTNSMEFHSSTEWYNFTRNASTSGGASSKKSDWGRKSKKSDSGTQKVEYFVRFHALFTVNFMF